MFSRRTDWSFEQNPFMAQLAQLKKDQVQIFDLTESNPTQACLAYPHRLILHALARPASMLYRPQPLGEDKARTAIAQMYARQGVAVDIKQIILTASSSEAYSFLFRLLLDPDDRALFPSPSYPLFDFLGQLNDVDLQYYSLVYDQRWMMDIKSVERKFSERTKAFVLVNPNNPTGCFVKKDELQAINRLCRSKNAAIICDEVFSDYVLSAPAEAVPTLAGNQEALTFVLGGLSKSLGLPQMKLSWIIVNGPQEKVDEALKRLEIIADTYLSVNTPSQNAVPVWLQHKERIQAPIRKRIIRNHAAAQKFCAQTSLDVLHVEGGWYGVLKLPDGFDEEAFTTSLLHAQHVFTHPGYFFDFQGGAHIVVSYLTKENIFPEGLRRIVRHVENG